MSQLQTQARLSWERFVIDLELLDVEAPHSLTPLIASLNQVLWPEGTYDQILRELNFMAFEVQHRTANLKEEEKIRELNRYFFCDRGFKICKEDTLWREESWQLMKVFSSKIGSGLLVSLIYLHLANQLDLPVFLVFSSEFRLVKWVNEKRCYFLDLSRSGLPLSEEQLLGELSVIQNLNSTNHVQRAFEILPNRQVFLEYASSLTEIFKSQMDLHRQHTSLNAQILLVEDDLELVAKRALLRKSLGFVKDALTDLQRYFSFIEKQQAPLELQEAFRDLIHIEQQTLRGPLEILH